MVPAALTPLGLGARTLVMGVLNATDDSFSGDGLGGDARRLAARGLEMVLAGADLLDIGRGQGPLSGRQRLRVRGAEGHQVTEIIVRNGDDHRSGNISVRRSQS
ncbi:MAG: dihydropteroate synthase [Chloroflexi bacterium]|nr:dihydropteroate synthase [Chloroflexota bacterium]